MERERRFSRRLVALYPRRFRERFGESLEQTLLDARREGRSSLRLFLSTALGAAAEHAATLGASLAMNTRTSAAIVSGILLLPLVVAFPLATLQIEPVHSLMRDLGTDAYGATNPIGYAAQIGLLLLTIAAGAVSTRSVLRTTRERGRPFADPVNLALAGAVGAALLLLITGVIIDQMPCWMGEPNCD